MNEVNFAVESLILNLYPENTIISYILTYKCLKWRIDKYIHKMADYSMEEYKCRIMRWKILRFNHFLNIVNQ